MLTAPTIPKIRSQLHVLADELTGKRVHTLAEIAALLHALAEATRRRKSAYPRAPNKSPPPTPQQVEQIRYLKSVDPYMPVTEIGNHVDCNIGRVSEVLNGKRDGRP